MRYVVVIPVYNESRWLGPMLDRLRATPAACGMERTIVIVDDGSTDGSRELVQTQQDKPDTVVVLHEQNKGKGGALQSGFRAAMNIEGASVVIVQDADMEYDPADHETMLGPIARGDAEAVIGSRFLGGEHRVLYFWHSVANRFITLLSNMLTNLNLTDIECGPKAFRVEVVRRLELREYRFGVEPEMVAKVARMRDIDAGDDVKIGRARVYEVPVRYAGRTYEEGKKIGWRDGVSALWCILKYNVLS